MSTSEAHVTTPNPARLITRLCKHFAHRIPATYDATSGRIEFEHGVCTLEAREQLLVMRVESADAEQIPNLEDVVGRHLIRMAHDETVDVTWKRAD